MSGLFNLVFELSWEAPIVCLSKKLIFINWRITSSEFNSITSSVIHRFYFRVNKQPSSMVQHLLYGSPTWPGPLAGLLPKKILQGQETYRMNPGLSPSEHLYYILKFLRSIYFHGRTLEYHVKHKLRVL